MNSTQLFWLFLIGFIVIGTVLLKVISRFPLYHLPIASRICELYKIEHWVDCGHGTWRWVHSLHDGRPTTFPTLEDARDALDANWFDANLTYRIVRVIEEVVYDESHPVRGKV